MYENPFEERFLIIAEKPSVALTIAAVLGFKEKKDGYVEGPDGYVTWCLGHLAEYAMPEAYDVRFKKWSLDTLPIIPDKWQLVVPKDKEKQFRVICSLLKKAEQTRAPGWTGSPVTVVNACDAGREGELIFNRVYELSGCTLPVKRLWISSMEDDAIFQGFLDLKDSSELRNLAAASVCRAQADWLIGMNASRAFTKVYDYRLTVGRVQTPTLAMLVKRGDEITGFQKTQYFITHLMVDSMGHTIDAVSEHFQDREEANRLAGICNTRVASVSSLDRQTRTAAAPKLYDLTSLQRDANRLFGMSASKTLSCAQNLYENKLITYPRTDSRFLTDDMEKTALDVISACRKSFPFLNLPETTSGSTGSRGSSGNTQSGDSYTNPYANTYERPNVQRLLNSKKVSDHHAIIPTVRIRNSDLSQCSEEEKYILIMLATRLICASGKDHVYESVKASFYCGGYTFTAAGQSVKEAGWKAVDAAMRQYCKIGSDAGKNETASEISDRKLKDEKWEQHGKEMAGGESGIGAGADNDSTGFQDLSSLYKGAQFMPVQTRVTDHWTQPPKQYTEDTLLHAMETAGASEMSDDVERKGLGTPATRAAIIDKLVASNYITRNKRQLIATDAGKQLVSVLPEYLKSAQMTADWENRLLQIERGQYNSQAFMDGITQLINRMLQDCRQIDEGEKKRFAYNDNTSGGTRMGRPGRESLGKCPVCGSPVYEGGKNFYCSDRNCRFVLWKQNRYLDRMRKSLDARMVKDLLANGRTHVKNLYSVKKDKYFAADLIMEWASDKATFGLEFPRHNN